MAIDNLVNERGPLAKTFAKLDPKTIQHSDEITSQRRDNEELRNQWFWTADFAMYQMEGSDAVLYLARRPNNLIFQNIEEATSQLIKTGNFIPSRDDAEKVAKAKSTLRLNLSGLGLERNDSEYSFFAFNLADPKLNKEQRKAVQRVYGRKDFKENMKMLAEAGVSTTRFYTLTPDYVKEHTKKGSALGRACWLSSFDYDSNFDADGRDVSDPDYALRGVLKKVGEADVTKKFGIPDAYQLLLKDPAQAVKSMTPEHAEGMSKLVAAYLGKKH